MSLGRNARPAFSRVPIVSKYPLLTMRVTVFGAGGDRLRIGAIDAELLLLRKRPGERRRRGHRGRLHRRLPP